ncbi:MAG: hypothetical protein HYZ29_34045 [Myxococcales bacterium]|nr:hypothetical protein [Myxococcales bacterium]
MGQRIAFASLRAVIGAAFVTSAAFTLVPACSSGDDFKAENTGGSSNTGGSAGDSGTTGGKGGTGGQYTGGSGGSSGSGGVAGNAGSGGASGSAGTDGGGGSGGNPNGKADGQACANQTECKSGYCVDDVCCESDCAGACRTCKASGKEGLCTPYVVDTDPEGDCKGAGAATDPCAGKCDGKSACKYPDASKACGAQVCSSATTSTFACSGSGACVKADKSCGNYQCSGANCLASCTLDSECVSSAYCENPACNSKLDLGKKCPKNSACKSGICVLGACCSTTCGPNFDCATGACQCNGQTCDAGVACITFYQDADGDGFGNKGMYKLGCANKPPTGYVLDNTDCYDNNKDAKPGQTQWFPTHRGDNSFDYNCDGTQEKQYPVVSASSCLQCLQTCSGKCGYAGFSCSGATGCPLTKSGYYSDVGCGGWAVLQSCVQNFDISGCISGVHVQAGSSTQQGCR